MKSAVIDIQRDAADSSKLVSDILRKAFTIATKLNIEDMQKQLRKEMNGYTAEERFPDYRIISGEIKAYNPYNGWIPIIIEDVKTFQEMTTAKVRQPIGELEKLITSSNNITTRLPLDREQWVRRNAMDNLPPLKISLHISKTAIHGILEAVRNIILDWSLALEKEGILGENLLFTTKEKEAAANITTYNIGTINGGGILGNNITTGNIQIVGYNDIHEKLKMLGVSQEERNELETIMDNVSKEPIPQKKKKLIEKGLEWVNKNAPVIGLLKDTIIQFFNQFH